MSAALITNDQVVNEYGLTRNELKRFRERRQLPYVKLGHRSLKYRRKDIERLIDRCTVEAVNA